jgi:hypothetical protein
MTIMRGQPPSAGHHAVAQKVKDLARENDADHLIYGSAKTGDKVNPLPHDVKAEHMRKVLDTDNVIVNPHLVGALKQIEHAHNLGYKKLTLVASGSRVKEYENFRKYFGKRTVSSKTGDVLDLSNIHPDDYEVHRMERDADADSGETSVSHGDIDPTTGKMHIPLVSGSKMRAAAKSEDFGLFHSMIPSHVSEADSRKIMDDVNKHGKNLQEEVSALTRMKLAKAARRTSSRRKIVRRSRAKRRKNLGQLKVRAKNEIVSQLRKKISGKRNWKKVPYSQRVTIDRNLARRKKLVTNMVKRIMPQVIKGESQRLKNLNASKTLHSSFDPVEMFMSNFLSEATKMKSKKTNRQPLDSAKKAKRKRNNTMTQRQVRGKREEKLKSGNVKGEVYAVKNKKGDVELVDKQSLRADHTILLDADKASLSTLKKFVGDKGFRNTDTSIRLFGLQKDAGGEKEGKKEKKESKEKKGGKQTSAAAAFNPPPQKIPASKKASKKDTYATSHDATAMESGIVYALNSMQGLTPQQMIEKGFIDEETLNAVMQNPNESFLPSCQRAAQQILKQFGKVYIKHTGKLKKETKLNKEAKDNGVTDKTPKSDLLLVDENGKVVATLSQKIGNSQLSSGGPAETITNTKWSMAYLGDKLEPSARKKMEKFIKFFEDELSGNPRTNKGPVSLYQKGSAREGQDEEVARREKLHDKATEMLNEVLNGDKDLAAAFVYSLLTGASKFEEGNSAIATHIFSANKDGTDAKITPIDMNYCKKIRDKVKFQMKFKSSAVETTDVKKKWAEFEERKKKLGQKVSIDEDFRQYAFRSVIRSYLIEEISFRKRVLNMILENTKENKLKNVVVKEPTTPEEGLQYLKDAFAYIGDDAFKLMQFFEDSIDFDTTQPIVDWTEFADSASTINNIITINGKTFEIPVEVPYDYTPDGNIESPLSEEYLDERDYKSEYRNYHSRPEQRNNRSKRVMARRLMARLGKVHKGDGKDVDHKDGNPQNNGKHNLRVRDKSENRADN